MRASGLLLALEAVRVWMTGGCEWCKSRGSEWDLLVAHIVSCVGRAESIWGVSGVSGVGFPMSGASTVLGILDVDISKSEIEWEWELG